MQHAYPSFHDPHARQSVVATFPIAKLQLQSGDDERRTSREGLLDERCGLLDKPDRLAGAPRVVRSRINAQQVIQRCTEAFDLVFVFFRLGSPQRESKAILPLHRSVTIATGVTS